MPEHNNKKYVNTHKNILNESLEVLSGASTDENEAKRDRAVVRCGGAVSEVTAAGDTGVDGERLLMGSRNVKSIKLHSEKLKFYKSIQTIPKNHNQDFVSMLK